MEVRFSGYGQWYVHIPRVHIQKTNIIESDDEITGIFKLTDDDVKEYERTKSFYHIKTMQPCLSPGSSFLKLVEERKIPKIDAEYVYFQVKRDRLVYSPLHRASVNIEVPAFFEIIGTETTPEAVIEQEEPNTTKPLKGRRDRQIDAICKAATELGCDDLLNIPEGGRAAIKEKCLENHKLFTESGFDRAWSTADKCEKIRMNNKEKYLKKKGVHRVQ